jgi:putative disulphide-isomerase
LNKLVNKEGMKFENLSFAEVLKKAKQENKLVFLDCYTTWCGPCKKMSNQVFPLKAVGDFMNARFVNVKIDMETEEGRELGKRYGVKSFPTMFLLNAEGEVLSQIVGAQSPDVFVEKVKQGLKQSE